jgi:AraC-like DNA-binding protein
MPGTDQWAMSEPLGLALHYLRMNGLFYSRAELTAPWGMTLPPMGNMWFHVIISGEALLEVDGTESVLLRRGDFALVPHGRGHVFRSDPAAPAPDVLELDRELISDRYEIVRAGGGGAPTSSVCGALVFAHPAARDLIEILPPTIHVEPADQPSDWMQGTFGLIAAEARQARPGGEAVITRLGDIVAIQAIRSWIENDPDARKGWLGALRDPQVGPAITLIHRDPERDWTVAMLAQEVAMSRSAFAARFRELVGEPVMRYVTRWRMQVAHEALSADGASAAEVAARFGYRSEAAFARAFKRVVGVGPGAARRGAGPIVA